MSNDKKCFIVSDGAGPLAVFKVRHEASGFLADKLRACLDDGLSVEDSLECMKIYTLEQSKLIGG